MRPHHPWGTGLHGWAHCPSFACTCLKCEHCTPVLSPAVRGCKGLCTVRCCSNHAEHRLELACYLAKMMFQCTIALDIGWAVPLGSPIGQSHWASPIGQSTTVTFDICNSKGSTELQPIPMLDSLCLSSNTSSLLTSVLSVQSYTAHASQKQVDAD